MDPLAYGILGTGNIARQFAAGVRGGAGRSRVVAVASRSRESAETFAREQGVDRAYAPYEALLDDPQVQAVYISLPNHLHHEWTLRCLAAGKHVLCEKPLAVTETEALEMFQAARRANRVLVEAFMYRAHPQTEAVVQRVRSGAIGQLKLIRLNFCFRVRKTEGNIRFSREMAGGALMDVGCYCINFSRLLAGGAPTEAHAVARLHESGVDEQTTAVLKFPGDVACQFTCGMMVQADNTAHVCGDEGYLTIGWPWKPEPPGSRFELRRSIPPRQDNPGAKPALPPMETIEVPNEKPLYGIEADEFARVVAGERSPFVSELESLENTRVLQELRRKIGLSF